jgi:hypothetical protein
MTTVIHAAAGCNFAAEFLHFAQNGRTCAMTPPSEFVECANCHCWFTAATADEVFRHATGHCRREQAQPEPFTDPSPPRNPFTK